MNLKEKRKNKFICPVLGIFVILFVTLFNIAKLQTIYIVPDEFGYWSAASFFCGYDWSSVTALNPYYSYGYGVLLAPLLLLQNSVLAYRLAIGLNSVFLCLSYLISIHCLSKLFPEVKKIWIICISLSVALYSNNVGLSQTTMCECLLFFLFWCVVLCFIELCEKGSTCWLFLYAVSLMGIYSVHMRTIGVLLVGGVTICLLLWKKIITRRQFICFAIFMIAGLIVGTVFKEVFQESLYSTSLLSSVNDYSGQVSKVQSLLSLQGIKDLGKSVFGKYWYLASATLGLMIVFIVMCIKQIKIKSLFRKEKGDVLSVVLLFLVLCFFAELMISSIAMINPGRIDALIYGRYNEFLLGPILSMTMCWLLSTRRKYWKEMIAAVICYVLLSLAVDYVCSTSSLYNIVYTNIIGIFRFCFYQDFSIITISAKCMGLACIFYIPVMIQRLFRQRKGRWLVKACNIGALCFITGVWLWNGFGYAEKRVYSYQSEHTDSKIAEIIDEIDEQEDLSIYYVYYPEDSTYIKNRIFTVQLALGEKAITIVDFETFEKGGFEDDAVYIINKESEVISEVTMNYEELLSTNKLELFTAQDNPFLEEIRKIVDEKTCL